jgi:hypothetical protein
VSPQPSIPRLAQLADRLWTGGGLPGRTDAATSVIGVWRSVGIHAVVDTRAEWSDEELVAAVAPEIAYINPGVVDGGQPMRDAWFETITAFASQHLSNGVGVLVHCHSGINRGPSAAFAVLLSVGWDPVEAIELIRTRRPIATVSYAEGALDWWLRSSGVIAAEHAATRGRFDQWRRADRAERFASAGEHLNTSETCASSKPISGRTRDIVVASLSRNGRSVISELADTLDCASELADNGKNKSLEVGYGPICAKRYGWPWGTS